MARLSELPRRAPPKRQSTPWLWLVLLVAGFAAGYHFNLGGKETQEVPPATLLHKEDSAKTNAAPSNEPELAYSEASAIARSPASAEVINAVPEPKATRPDAQSSSVSDDRRLLTTQNYGTLRREFLRHLR